MINKSGRLGCLAMVLAGLTATTPARAATNTWNNLSTDFLWNSTSANWTAGGWTDGDDAIFGGLGVGAITLSSPVIAQSLTFSAAGYTLTNAAGGNTLTLAGTNSGIKAVSSASIAASIEGTDGVTIQGPGTVTFLGNANDGLGNQYTGGTYVRSGTLVLNAAGVSTSGSSYGVDSIEAIDTGATVKIGTVNDGLNTSTSNVRPPDGQLKRLATSGRLNLTGGTFDNNGDNNGIQYPPPEGAGIVVNSSPYARAVMKLQRNDGGTYVFNGQIKDGGPTINYTYNGNSGAGYQQNIDMNGGNYTLVLGGSNSFTGFLRLNSGSGNHVILMPGGTLGYAAPINCPSRQILMNSGLIDLNGTSQKVGYVYTGNDANSVITNSAFGTVSTLTVCYNCTNTVAFNGAATPRGIRSALLDDPTTGGTLALTKEGVAIQPIGNYSGDGTPAANNYHGDTTVNNGILEVLSLNGISPNSTYRLNTTQGKLQLDYSGTAPVYALYLDGIPQPNGVYGSTNTSAITGPGTLQVTTAPNTWNNASTDFFWNGTSTNWVRGTWLDGDDAFFGAAGIGAITINAPVVAHNLDFNSPGYTVAGAAGGNTLTLSEVTLSNTAPTITANASVAINANIHGTNGLIIQGAGSVTLQGGTSDFQANNYTGGTYVHSGTLVVQCLNTGYGNNSGSGHDYGVDSIEALDAGAVLQIGNMDNYAGTFVNLPKGQIANPGNANVPSHLHLTGGTFDLNGWNRNSGNTQVPCPDGSGLIINTSSNSQSALVIVGDGQNHTFSGSINDGGPVSLNGYGSDKSYQIGIVDFHYGTGGYEVTLSGSNTYSGSTRLGNASVKLSGAGTLGVPSAISGVTGPLRVYGPNHLDLNGTSQTIGAMGAGDANGKIYNTAVGTVSTLNFGFGPNSGTCPSQFIDNPGTGGILAMHMIGSSTQSLSGANTYSGDTTVSSGTLAFTATQAVSPDTRLILSTASGILALNYTGTATVKGLIINGVNMPNGIYGAETAPITGTGFIQVTGGPLGWNNASGDFNWNLTSTNWSSVAWIPGGDAYFGALGIGTVAITAETVARNIEVVSPGYAISGQSGGNTLTLAGVSPTITINADFTNAASIYGTNGLTVQGTGTMTLQSDTVNADGNHYTGGTYVRSGTLLLNVANANTSGTSYAVDSIEALDAGATVAFGTTFNGSTYSSTRDQIAAKSSAFDSHLHMTGGTLDLNNDPKNQRIPIPEGTGLIINTGTNVQAGLNIVLDGKDHTFSGVIADGGPLVGDNSGQGPGRQIGIVNFSDQLHGGGGEWSLAGSNTYSGSTRIDNGGSIKLVGNGTIGFPTPNGLTGPLRIYGPGHLDLNGHNQTIALMTGGNSGGKVYNSAVGTVSTLTFGYGNESVTTRNASMQYIDNPGVGGVLALTKIGASCIQTFSGVNTYSGDTTITAGTVAFANTTSVSPNTRMVLFTASGTLKLNYTGTATVRALNINGVEMPNGTYGAETAPITGTGFIQVTGSTARPTLTGAVSGGSLAFTWPGSYKLQAQTNSLSGNWFDYPNGTNGVSVPVDHGNQSVFFRLAPLP